MFDKFSHRLIGTIALVSFAVFVLPWLLNGKKDPVIPENTEMMDLATGERVDINSANSQAVVSANNIKSTIADQPAEVPVTPVTKAASTPPKTTVANKPTIIAKSSTNEDATASSQPQVTIAKANPAEKELATKTTATKPAMAKIEPKQEASTPVNKPSTIATKPVSTAAEQATATQKWAIQLGVFNNIANVNALVAKLKTNNIPMFTIPTKPQDGKATRVLVGPDTSESAIKTLQIKVNKLTGEAGKIISYSSK